MGKYLKVTIHGYGTIKVRKPKKLTRTSCADMVGSAVAKTMQLVDPQTQKKRFHPVMGFNK